MSIKSKWFSPYCNPEAVPTLVWLEALERLKNIANQLGRYPRSGVRYTNSFDDLEKMKALPA